MVATRLMQLLKWFVPASCRAGKSARISGQPTKDVAVLCIECERVRVRGERFDASERMFFRTMFRLVFLGLIGTLLSCIIFPFRRSTRKVRRTQRARKPARCPGSALCVLSLARSVEKGKPTILETTSWPNPHLCDASQGIPRGDGAVRKVRSARKKGIRGRRGIRGRVPCRACIPVDAAGSPDYNNGTWPELGEAA